VVSVSLRGTGSGFFFFWRTYHEVEAGHQEDEVDQQEPVALESHFAFREEGRGDILAGFADGFALAEDFGFREAETESDDEDWRAGAEPEELKVGQFLKTRGMHGKVMAYRPPAMACCVDKTSCEGCGKKVTESISTIVH